MISDLLPCHSRGPTRGYPCGKNAVLWQPIPTCGQLPELVNGALSLSSGVNEGSVATYTCDTGFNLIGSATRTCTSDEGWTPAVPVCLRIIDCGRLLSPSNGNVATPSGTTVGNVALYSCDNGLLLTGPSVRVCGNNELWTPDAPTCEEYPIVFCPDTNGIVILPTVVAPINCIEGDLRLVNGENELEGRVEVCFYGIWGTVCDDSWDIPDATVVCNQLGHSVEGAEAFGRAMFGEGEGFILLNGVNCTGNEERLENCGSSDYVAHNCTHGEDAGVRCMALRGLVVTQPVRLPLDLRLITENLIAPTDDFEYLCLVNGVNLTAQYENENTILCIVGSGNLTLSAGVGSSLAVVMVVMVIWPVNNVNNTLSSTVPLTEVTLYDCRNLASGCLECIAAGIGLEFPCGWCGGSCEVMQECSNSFITEGDNCPAPVINSFTPMSGPVQGGTEITVNGTDLGVTFADIQSSNLTLGGVTCSPINTGYKIGCQFVCMTTNLRTEGPKNFSLTIGSREAIVNAGSFTAVYPTVNSVTPTFGPMAGGTIVAVSGTGLDVGNQEDTRVSLNISGSSYVCNVLLRSIQSHEIRCTTTEANFTSNAMLVVSIDAATISNPGLVFSYLDNPNVINVFPSNTISSGGIMLTFTGLNFDVVQQPVLEVYQPFEAPLRSNCSLGNGTICSAVNITTITCSTPNVSGISLNYALLFDDVPPTTQACFPISVQSDPSNFRLETSEEVITGTVNFLRIVGDNLDSVETSEIRVTVGGEECVLTPSERRSVIICTAPFKPPGGGNTSIINVTVGSNIAQELHKRLTYKVPVAAVILPVTDRVPLQEIIISLSAIIFLLVVCVLIVFICLYLNYRKKKSVSIKMHQQNMELVATGRYQEIVDGNTALVKSELNKIAESIPDSFKIPSSTLKLSSNTIGQGEFGIVYKGVLIDWNNVPMQGVAVKTLKGLFSLSDVQSMVCEVNKMQDLHHPHVMSLIGVCLDAGPGIAIVMPYMANGSLFDYLKKERDILELDDDCEIDQILAVRKLLLKMCHQIALGMAYLAEQKFVHRDLAARNCMLDSGGGIRVGDFGLAEDIYASGYFRQNNRANVKVPYKWMALESLNDAIFTEKTDVWSYGVTVWEIFNGGRCPYPAVDPLSLIQLLEEGRRLERSLNAACATEIYVVMRKCWREDPEERPTFSQLSSIVERLLTAIADYTELGMVLVDTSQEEEQLIPHHYGNLPSADPLTTEKSAYCLGEDSQEKEKLNNVPTMMPTGEVPHHYDDLPSVTENSVVGKK
ncbi:hepatocyte growth factor receptor-like isoform X2 [Halichondria panicea]|uniref:hepatocyte growth factor receptor-like isoform X2 n=1 Tax=Halichondria panicea TaxID=6063 RepID=UPI00312B368D